MKRLQRLSFSFLILLFAFVMSGAAFAAETYYYATTDMTWAEFYAGEIGQTSTALKEAGLDAYTSATAVRMFSADVAYTGTSITGLKSVQVRMTEEIYNTLKNTTVGRGQTGLSRFTIVASDDTGTYFEEYKDVTAQDTFGAMVTESRDISGVTVTLASGANASWGSYLLNVSTDLSAITASNYLGVVIETDDGSYGLRHVNNMWRNAKDLGLTVDDAYVEIHGTGVQRDYAYTADIVGKTINKIKYIVKDAADIVISGLNIKLEQVPTVKAVVPDGGLVFSAGKSLDVKFNFENVPASVSYDAVVSVQEGGGRRAITLSADTHYTYDLSKKVLTLKSPSAAFYRVVFKSSSADIAPNIRAGFYVQASHFATTDMTWAEFYAGELGETADELKEAGLDAYTSATAKRFPLVTSEGNSITGVKDIQVSIPNEVYEKLTDTSRYTFIGATDTAFSEYKVLSADGSFGKMVTESTDVTDAEVTVASGASATWGSYQLNIKNAGLDDVSSSNLLGVVISTDEGAYGLRPVNNMWSSASDLAVTVDDAYVEIHGTHVTRDYKYTSDIVGKTIKSITYLVKDSADVVISGLNLKLETVPTVKAAEPETGFLIAENLEIKMSFDNVPSGINYSVATVQEGGGRSAVTLSADTNYTYDSSTKILTLKAPKATFYRVTFNSSNADAAPNIRAGFYLYTVDVTNDVMTEENNAAGLMFRITPEGAFSKTDALLKEKNWVNATDYTDKSVNTSAAYTEGENEITGSGFTFDVTLKDVPEGKTAILGFGGMATLTASSLGSADVYNKVATRIKANDYAEEDGQIWYGVDETTFKELGISVKSVNPSRDLTPTISAGACFADDATIILAYGAMLADSASETEGTYQLSNEGAGEILLNDGAADGHIKATWYLAISATAASNGSNGSGENTNPGTKDPNNPADDENNGGGGTRTNEMATPVNVTIPAPSAKAQENFAKESVIEKIIDALEDALGISIPATVDKEVKELPSDIQKSSVSVTQSEMEKAGAKFTASEDAPVVLETVTITESAIYYIPVPKENLTVGMKIFIHLLKNIASVQGVSVYAADSEAGEVEAVFADDDGKIIDTVPADKDVNIVAYMEADNTYTPVVTSAENDDDDGSLSGSGGGCNSGIFAPVLLLGALLLMKRR